MLFLALACGQRAGASHIMGADFSYTYVGKSGSLFQYKFVLKVYRDCNSGSQLPATAGIGIYNANNNTQYGSTSLARAAGYTNEKKITPPCISSNGVCVAEVVYEVVYSLAPSAYGYYITASACCRNAATYNVNSPGSTGMSWSMFIPPTSYTNNSVNFSSLAVVSVCNDDTISFNHNAYDPDGDSLVYTMVTPYAGAGAGGINAIAPGSITNITWPGAKGGDNFALSYPLGNTNSWVGLNSVTGELRIYTTLQQNYVLSVEVKEYRKLANGTSYLVNTSRRDLQIIARPCGNYNPPKVVLPSGFTDATYYNRTVTIGDTLCFDFKSYDSINSKISLTSAGAIFTGVDGQCGPYASMDSTGGDTSVTQTFCWIPGCCRVGQTYIFTVTVQDTLCGSVQKTFSIKVNPMGTLYDPDPRVAHIVSKTSVKLSWTPPISVGNFKRFKIFRRPAGGTYALIDSVSSATATTYTDNGVSNADSMRYEYLMRTQNTCDSLSPGKEVSTISTGISKLYSWRADLEWNAPSNTGKYKYHIYRNTSGGNYILIDSTSDTIYYVNAAKCADSINFYVIAYDSITRLVAYSNESNKELIADVVPPIIMGFKRATINNSNTVMLEWKRNDSFDVKYYRVYKFNGSTYVLLDSITSNNSSNYFYYDTTVVPNQSQYLPCYKIQARDSCGNYGSMYEEHCPVNLQGKAGNLKNALWWTAYSGFQVDSIHVYRVVNGGTLVRIKTLDKNATSWEDTGLICNQEYTYLIQFNSLFDTVINSQTDTVMLFPFDTIPPSAPAIKYVTVVNDKQVNLYFTKSPSADINNYDVFRSTNGGSYQLVKTFNYPAASLVLFNDTGLNTLRDKYCYYIAARDSCSNLSSPPSEIHCDVQLKGTPGNNRAFLYWNTYKGFNVAYNNVQKYVNGYWVNITSLYSCDSTYEDSTGVACGANLYRMEMLNGLGTIKSYSDTLVVIPVDTIAPIKPIISVITNNGPNSLSFTFSKSNTDVDRYILYRGVDGGALYPYDTLDYSYSSYTDTGVKTYEYYYCYALEAIDSCGNNSSGKSISHCSVELKGKLDFCNKKIQLNWNSYQGLPLDSFQVFRSMNGGAYILYLNQSPSDSNLSDTISPFNLYKYRIRVKLASGSAYSWSDSVEVNYFPIRGPIIEHASKTLTSSTTGEIEIRWNALALDSFVQSSRLYYSSNGTAGSFALLANNLPPSQQTYNHTSINTSTANHWYYMLNVDSCGKVTDSTSIHKTSDLTVLAKKIRNKMYWTRYKGWPVKYYFIERKDSGVALWTIDTVSGTDSFYTDYPSPCNGYVHYRISAQDSSGQYIAWSDTVTIPPLDTIASDSGSFQNVSVVADGIVEITFLGSDSSDIYAYSVRRSDKGGAFKQVKLVLFGSPGQTYIEYDTTDTRTTEYTYQLYVIDSCLNATPSTQYKQLQLRGQPDHLKSHLVWNKFAGYQIRSYYILRWDNPSSSFQLLDSVDVADSTYIDDNLPCNQTQIYQVLATEYGGGRYSLSDTLWLTPFDSVAPSPPSIYYVTIPYAGSIEAAWSKPTPDVGGYTLYITTPSGGFTDQYTYAKDDTTVVISGLNTDDSVYQISVTAYDSCSTNTSTTSSSHEATNTLTAALNKAVKLEWLKYIGFVSETQMIQKWVNGAWANLYNPGQDSSYIDTGLGCNQTYSYRIVTTSSFGKISFSDSVSAIPYDTIKPEPAKLKYASVSGNNSIDLFWAKSASPDVRNHEVWRSMSGGVFSRIADVVDVTNFTDSGIYPQSLRYCYYVLAYDSCNILNRSVSSDTECVMKLSWSNYPCRPQIDLNWSTYSKYTAGTANYTVIRSDSVGQNNVNFSLNANTTSLQDTNVIYGATYCYVVKSIDSSGQFTSFSDSFCAAPFVYPVPSAPFVYFATVSHTDNTLGKVRLVWSRNPAADTLARGYHIYGSSVSVNSGYNFLADITKLNDTSYIHDSINTVSGRYWYKIVTYDLCDREGFVSETSSPVNLEVTAGNLQNRITWSRYEGWLVGLYIIERSDNRGNVQTYMYQVDSSNFALVDTLVSCGVEYIYRIHSAEMGFTPSSSWSDSVRATPFDTIPPAIAFIDMASVETTSDVAGTLLIQLAASMERNRSGYKIYRSVNGGSLNHFVDWIDPLPGTLYYTDANLNTRDSIYSYYVTTTDSCGNESAPSDLHTAMNMTATAMNDAVLVSWTAYEGFPQWDYIVERMDADQISWTPIFTLDNLSQVVIDSSANCNKIYYYRITAIDPNGMKSYSDTQYVLTFDTSKPIVSEIVAVSVTGSSSFDGCVTLNWKHSSSRDVAHYLVERRLKDDANWQQLGISGYTTNYIDGGLSTTDTVYFYRIRAIDSCDNISEYSEEHGTIRLMTTPGEQNIRLNWNSYFGWPVLNYIILRENNVIAIMDSGTYAWLDTPLTCTQLMAYQIQAVKLNDLSVKSNSDSSINRAEDHTPPQASYLKYVTVDKPNTGIKLEWGSAGGFDVARYEVFRKYNGSKSWTKLITTDNADTFYYDEILNLDRSNCYRVVATDSCGNVSNPSNEACIVFLEGKPSLFAEGSGNAFYNFMHFNEFTYWKGGVDRYEMWRMDDNNAWQHVKTFTDTPYSHLDSLLEYDIRNFCYRLVAVQNPDSGDARSYSNLLCLQQQPRFWMPNAFSPNDDDINETYGPIGTFINKYDLVLYNRWGEEIFVATPSVPRWDGKFNGVLAPGGLYMYRLKVYSYDEREYNVPGTFILLR